MTMTFLEWIDNQKNTLVYHRTGSLDQVKQIWNDGFTANPSAYGDGVAGVFFNFDLKNWLSDKSIQVYGQYLVEAALSMDKIIIDDGAIQKYKLGKERSTQDQMEALLAPDELNVIAKKHGYKSYRHIFGIAQENASMLKDMGFVGMVFPGKGSFWVMVFDNGVHQLLPKRWTEGNKNIEWHNEAPR